MTRRYDSDKHVYWPRRVHSGNKRFFYIKHCTIHTHRSLSNARHTCTTYAFVCVCVCVILISVHMYMTSVHDVIHGTYMKELAQAGVRLPQDADHATAVDIAEE